MLRKFDQNRANGRITSQKCSIRPTMRSTRSTKRTSSQSLRSSKTAHVQVTKTPLRSKNSPASSRKSEISKSKANGRPQTDTNKRRVSSSRPTRARPMIDTEEDTDDEPSPVKKPKTESPTLKTPTRSGRPTRNSTPRRAGTPLEKKSVSSPSHSTDDESDGEALEARRQGNTKGKPKDEKQSTEEPGFQNTSDEGKVREGSKVSRELKSLKADFNKKGRLEKVEDEAPSRRSKSRQSIHIDTSSDEDASEEDVIFEGEEIEVDSDAEGRSSDGDNDSNDENDVSIKDNLSDKQKNLSAQQTAELYQRIIHLEMEMVVLKQNQKKELRLRDEKLTRMSNELKWKNEQLTEMNSLADRNMELESKIKFLLSEPKNYEKEIEQLKQKEEQEKKEIEKVEEGKKKQEAEEDKKMEDEDEAVELDEETGKKKRRRSGRKKKKEEEDGKDEIDAYFVDDDSDIEVIKEDKLAEKKKDSKQKEDLKGDTKDIKEGKKDIKESKKDLKEDKEEDKKSAKENEEEDSPQKGRHNIRKLMTGSKLQEGTKLAAKAEKERVDRVKKEHDKHLKVTVTDPKTKQPVTKQLILAFKQGTKTPLVEVNQKLIKKLKPHQVEAVEFLWDNVIESMDMIKEKDAGSGCLLAHCMGLGKTLSVIALIHTLLTTRAIGFKRCLVVCPLNTVLNWQCEWEKWLDKKDRLTVHELVSAKHNHERADRLATWKKGGGIMVMGYQIFRILVNYSGRSKRLKKTILDALIDPGPDVVVCDEGHILKNDVSAISKCMNQVRTKRRIVLTGTPLQNNLVEYHCMVNFVKPNLLGSRREFGNRFVNPITNGQHSDSTARDVKVMKRRAHILHSMLDGCVQRRDYTALVKFLPPKHEYVLSIRLSKLQIELYQKYLEINRPEIDPSTNPGGNFKIKGTGLFADYQNLMRIWTHPWVLKLDEIRQDKKPFTEDDDDELESIIFTSSDEEEESTVTTTTSEEEGDEHIVMGISSDEADNSADSAPDPIRSGKKRTRSNSARLTRNRLGGTKAEKDSTSDKDDVKDEPDVKRNTRTLRDRKTKDQKKKSSATETETESETEVKSSGRSSPRRRQQGTKESEKKDKKHRSSSEKSGIKDSGDTDPSTRKAKVIAGEVIKQWQTTSRGDGQTAEVIRKKEDPWWYKFVQEDHKTMLELSGKIIVMFEILKMAETLGDKVLVFSQSLLTLDIIEDFLAIKNEEAQKKKRKKTSRWVKDEDYCRMDGSTGAQNRSKLTATFNNIKNKQMRLFLISTRAGGLGINLDSANRVIIFDASWNPSHDIQSIFRVYRFGQEKDVFIYRFLAQGTMEEKIYERQVTKETLSQRVIDEHQIDRHFTASDLQELYKFTPDRLDDPNRPERPTPAVPKDLILAELLSSQKDWIVQYHEHDSLLENRPDEDLSEEERKAAWEEYEREKRGIGGLYRTINTGSFGGLLQSGPVNTPQNPPVVIPSYRFPYIPSKGPGSLPPGVNMQIAQLPRVVQEILKYNPSISSDELSKRLQTFLGMHTRYNQVPGLGPSGPQTLNVSVPGLQIPQLQNLVSSLPTLVGGGSASSAIPPVSAARLPATSLLMPSRLPLPGNLPASKK